MHTYTIQAIGYAKTPFKEKFGIPRQASLVEVPAEIHLLEPFNDPVSVKGLESVSHLWLEFIFDQHVTRDHKLTVRPPRLGGNEKVGVFATRSSFRPNNIGLSKVQLEEIKLLKGKVVLKVRGVDLLNDTPIIDIKPYLPYSDIEEDAWNHLASAAPDKKFSVTWTENALGLFDEKIKTNIETFEEPKHAIKEQIETILSYDPRPAYKANIIDEEYGMLLYMFDIRWCIKEPNTIEILSV